MAAFLHDFHTKKAAPIEEAACCPKSFYLNLTISKRLGALVFCAPFGLSCYPRTLSTAPGS